MNVNVQLPRVYDENLNFLSETIPIKLSLTLSIVPLSYASMQLPWGESLPARGYVEIFTPMGSAGFFRVRSPQEAYGDDIVTSELEHAIVEVGDYLVLGNYNEMMSAKTAMQTIFSHYRGSKWRLGNVDALGDGQIALQTDHDRVLGAMIALLEQKPDCMMAFDFSTTPWTVNIVSRGTTVSAEGRLSRNVNSAKVAYDDTELVTRCYYEYSVPGSGSTEPSSAWAYVDTDTISRYGLVERTAPINGAYTQTEARAAAVAYAEKHKNPRVSVSISAEELSSITGEDFDAFVIGKLCRLALLDYNITIEQVITGLSWGDVFDAPEDVTVILEDEEDTTVTFLHDLDAKGGAGGGGGGAKKQEELWKEYYTHFDKTDYYIDMWARHVDTTDRILQQAGMYLDSNGVLVYATDYENNVGAKIKVNADAIALKVSKGDVATQLAVECGNVTITGGNLVVDGYVTANELEILEDAWADSFTSKSLSSDTAALGVVDVDEINGVVGPQGINISVDGVLKATVLGSGNDVNFDRAAAKREGAAAVVVTLDTGSWTAVDSSTGNYQRTVTAKKNGVSAATDTISAQQIWNLGWNACRAWVLDHSHTVLSGYSSWNSGNAAALYVAPTGGAQMATGKTQKWRYGGTVTTYYSAPSSK